MRLLLIEQSIASLMGWYVAPVVPQVDIHVQVSEEVLFEILRFRHRVCIVWL